MLVLLKIYVNKAGAGRTMSMKHHQTPDRLRDEHQLKSLRLLLST